FSHCPAALLNALGPPLGGPSNPLVALFVQVTACAFRRRRARVTRPMHAATKPGNPAPTTGPGTPTTFEPAVVPKENVAPVTVESAVSPEMATTNVAVPSMNGLCGPLPAIEPLALL